MTASTTSLSTFGGRRVGAIATRRRRRRRRAPDTSMPPGGSTGTSGGIGGAMGSVPSTNCVMSTILILTLVLESRQYVLAVAVCSFPAAERRFGRAALYAATSARHHTRPLASTARGGGKSGRFACRERKFDL